TFRFLHDRVQQAAYALTPGDQRAGIHLQIGRLLHAAMSASELALAPFEVVNNLNRGIELLAELPERRLLAELNLRAARRAQGTSAYDAALYYLNTGLSLLGQDCWERDYDLAYDLHKRRLQVDFVTGAFEHADQTFALLQAHVHDPIDRAYVATQQIVIATASERSDAAIALGLSALRELGVRIPTKPNAVHVVLELIKNRWLVGRRRPTDLVKLPDMHDKRLQAVLQILKVISVPAYIQNPYLMALVAAKITNMSIRHGNGSASPQGYVLHGLVIGAFTGDYQAGYDFGSAAVTLSERFDDIGVRCNALYVFAGYISPWIRPQSISLTLLNEAYRLAVEAGHTDYAVYAILTVVFSQMSLGTPLDEIRATVDRHQPFVDESKNDFGVLVNLTREWVDVLQGREGAAASATEYAQSRYAAEVLGSVNPTRLVEFLIFKLQLAYHLGEYETAAETGAQSEAHVDRVLGQIISSEHYFYYGLVAAAMAKARPSETRKWTRILTKCRKKFSKWSVACAENFEDKRLLLDAESTAVSNPESALGKYDAAIASSERHGFVHNAAMANELAGRLSLSLGRRTVATVYLRAATGLYARWGALGKVRKLAAEFPDHSLTTTTEIAAVRATSGSWEVGGIGETMDLDSVLKTAQTISGERQLDRLLDRLLRLVLENAGAERGCVIVRRDGDLLIEASGSVGDASITVLQAEPADASAELCYPIVQYVARTKGDLVLADARRDARFMTDAYVVRAKPKSVLCSPVLKQGELIGLLYLENNLTSGAFTPQRLRVLQLIGSEVATAIENARLSENLQMSAQALEIARSKVDLLEKAKVELAKFVPKSVQRAIEAHPDSPRLEKRTADVSVLFLDLAGYTRMCEVLGTDQAHDTVQRYFSSYLVDVIDNDGEIAETAGDGLMILFQDPDPGVNAANAARAALAIRQKTRDLNATAARDAEAVVVNIGINSGPASLGASKFESAAGTRYTYTASGSTTNLAARVGAAATGGSILVTADTARRVEGRFELSDQGRRSLKNVAEPVWVFSLDAERPA
ncbi:MAG: adenylate/guanylate cyclase domain-containing protein, partial [Gemmatimonas sp.]